jgi:GntR family transcriptional regulator
MFEDIDPQSSTPLWDQIAARVRVAVASGELRPGEILPSVRELARRLRVNPATVAQAYKELAREGFVETRHGAGTFVREVSADRRSRERRLTAEDLIRRTLIQAARLGIGPEELAEAFDRQLGSKINE